MAVTDADGDSGADGSFEVTTSPRATDADADESGEPRPSADDIARRSAAAVDRRRLPTALDTVRAVTGVAKVAVTAAGAVTVWSVDTAFGVSAAVLRGSIAGAPTRSVLADAEAEFREALRRALGLPAAGTSADAAGVPTLREQGAALLRLSASPHGEAHDIHPAFARMLADLTPDEARILRFLHLDGAQPTIDIRTGRPRGLGAERVVSGLNLIGEHAGLRFPNRVPQYLPNLRRLGLIEFTREPVGNPNRYQILEAQSPVREVLKRSGFGTKVYYRSIALTDFGADFVRTCLPVVVQDGRASGTH
ncbi:Abi-alpha family protein [Nocardia arizonensis]|uniref:Abi-alpha family protein n=1 Tax=Nocardia arizonensis TaxID=1141647 RepID=UPI0009E85B47|nr:Abi-alpha family protein [Nocardia arizonensis]